MESSYEQNGICYILVGDYYYPDLLPDPDEETEAINQLVRQMAERLGVVSSQVKCTLFRQQMHTFSRPVFSL